MRTESRPVSRFTGQRIHFIGIGGCGMSGLARVLLDAGAIVTGSDPTPNQQTMHLAQRGVKLTRQQDGALLSREIDLVVRTAAVPDNNLEYQVARRLGIPQVKYAQLLGEVMAERLGVAVAGTHGKSTTTAMISFALLECGTDPSFVVGGTVGQLGGSSRSGAGPAFVVEACEYDRSFHNLIPAIALITNIEEDHLDCYTAGIREIIEAFRLFALRVPAEGRIIANGIDPHVRSALKDLDRTIEWVGISEDPENAGLTWATRPTGIVNGCHTGEVYYNGQPVATLRLSVAGAHNLFNATTAIATCHACGVGPAEAAEALGRFAGVDRRMAWLGTCNSAIIVDDYGHHPTEIRTTLRALRERYSPKRLICVFQPHQHSRTRLLLDDFAASFSDADLTILPDIYSARDSEADQKSVGTPDLLQRILAHGQQAMHIPALDQIVRFLRTEAREGDLVVTMGAGNVCEVGEELACRVE